MLTDAQKVDVRRWAGYQLAGDSTSAAFTIPVFVDQVIGGSNGVMPGMTLDYRLSHLAAGEEAVLVNTYLAQLTALESAVFGSSANLDTDVAAVWTHNKNEVADRTRLFNQVRRDMCAFIGLRPGPTLGSGGLQVVRA